MDLTDQEEAIHDVVFGDWPMAGDGLFPTESLHVGRPNIGSRETFLRYAGEIFDRNWLTNDGPLVRIFEQRVAALLGVKHCVATCNGTIALEIAVRALGLKGEVILPSYTFIATAHALEWTGITPVFADIDPTTHNLDPDSVRRCITKRTSGILGVHLWGRGAPIDDLQAIATEHNLTLFFDAAHAFGCSIRQQFIGNFGDAEVLSFHATKIFNTFEGGAIVTNDDKLAERSRQMRNFGFAGLDCVTAFGTNGKMPEICAAMGLTNLDSLDHFIATNRRNYLTYRHVLDGTPGITLLPFDKREQNNYQYIVIEVGPDCGATRDQIVNALHAENVLARKYFWPGCHRMQPYREQYQQSGLQVPATELVADRVIVLPTGLSLAPGRINAIGQTIRRLAAGGQLSTAALR